ncbi:hypothetical protein [Ruegeria sp. HKCCD8929]|uniref:hypothetical protein n=1 Tax=Ruegeria sp. HKCCD8929 TaxID=2683006 RepID=UPI001488A3B5|nr:hypothetical protein [Ruegeria sp. HKCCD8929]
MRALTLIRTGLTRWFLTLGLLLGFAIPVQAGDIAPFIGDYLGSAEVVDVDGTATPRDMSVSISETKDGFNVSWATITYKADGRVKESKYSVDFLPTDRSGIFSAAMRRNVFGHAVQLDPMKGEPFVWGRIDGDVLTVYSLFVDDQGGYELQQFDRTLAENGLNLSFSRLRNGEKARSVETFLQKQ